MQSKTRWRHADGSRALPLKRIIPLERARGLLQEAMFDANRWESALGAVAEACGARVGQLIALDGQGAVSDHWLTGAPEGFAAEIEAFGLSNPAINPRLRIGARAPLLQLVADQDYVDADERKRSPIYAEMFEPRDLPFNCQIVLMREPHTLVRASITRTRKQGAFDHASLAAIKDLVPHLHAAVRVQTSLLAARCSATLSTLEAVGAAAFLLSETGRVIGASPAAEALAIKGSRFQVTDSRLRLRSHSDQAKLETIIARALAAQRANECHASEPLVLSGPPLVLEVQLLPRERMSFGGAPALIVIARRLMANEWDQALQQDYGLTTAEAQVAMALTEGDGVETIASRRSVSTATVRSQIQSIYSKLGVRRQSELVAIIRGLGAI